MVPRSGTLTTRRSANAENATPDGNVVTTGTNGYIKGALNAPPGIVVGSAIPLKECNIKVASGSLIPTGIQGGNC